MTLVFRRSTISHLTTKHLFKPPIPISSSRLSLSPLTMSTTTQNEKYLSQHPEPQYHKGTGQQYAMKPQPVDDTLHDGSRYKAAGKLEGEKTIITGADSGIGRSTALLFGQ